MRGSSIRPTNPRRGAPGAARVVRALVALALAGLAGALSSCIPPSVMTLRSGLDSLRAVVDTLTVRDSVMLQLVRDTRREMADQRDILLSTKATAGSTTQDLFDQMGRLQGKLDEVIGRFGSLPTGGSSSAPSGGAPAGADANQLYEQATQDLSQGRYTMALQGFRDVVQRFPSAELADNAQYGVAECLFAQSKFDSAATEYARVEASYPKGDKVPAALYKLALTQEKLGRPQSKATLEDLVKRFPLSGEAQLARERLGTDRRR